LRSGDPQIPETTLVLVDDVVSGWSASGRIWGDYYFFGAVPNSTAGEMMNEVFQPFVRRLT
jgi:hypothetical protein